MEGGYIKIHRSILNWEWYDDPKSLSLFIHILIKANYEPKRWQGIVIERGAFITSVASLKRETNLTNQNIRTSLKKFVSSGEIIVKTTNKYTMITVCNYGKYQDVEGSANKRLTNQQQTTNNQITNQLTNEQQTTNKPLTTTKERKEIEEIKEYKNKRKGKNEFLLGFDFSKKLRFKILDFYDYRKEIKKPMTKQSEKIFLKKIKSLEEETAIAQIEQSMLRCWVDIFPVKIYSEKINNKGYMEPVERNDKDRLKFS